MKTQNGLLKLFMIAVAALTMQFTLAQTGVLDPNDPIVVYNPGSPPATPPYGTLAKWVKTNRLSWNTSTFKCYFYNGVAFRLRFPKSYQHGVNDGKKYPVYLFFHGRGEKGTIYDNEYQLYHGGQSHMNAVVADKFDGFLLYPQNQTDGWGAGLTVMSEFIQNYLVPQCKADRFRIIVDGLSAGGAATWKFLVANYKVPAAVLPISNTDLAYLDAVQQFKFTPMWQFQGGLDKAPSPGYTQQLANGILNVGGNYKLTVYPTLGHGCWNQAWAETDYYPFLNRAYKSNPWVLFGRSEFCPGDNINVTIGVTPGFNAYEWRKDGNLISGATGNQITVTSVGVYSCRMRDGATLWSDWSPIPMEIKYKTSANIPSITVAGLASKVIPSLDGSTGVTLQVPEGYATYSWQKEPSSTVLSTTNTVNATTPGNYKVRVTEQFGCSSDFSAPFTVIDANGPNKPEAPINLSATTLSKTAIKLDWSDNPQPQYNETGFEIYEARSSDGPYSLVSITGADVLTYTRTDLNANTRYYYKLRAVNETAASAASNVANTITEADTQAPTAPEGLSVSASTRYSVDLSWGASTDDVGVTEYEVYINGQKLYTTVDPQITIYNLNPQQSYNFVVRAKDFAGNASPFSNQVTAQTIQKGLAYRYYQGTGWTALPNFDALTPVDRGIINNVTITPRLQDDNFGFVWEGYIRITTAGSYTFRTTSDAGSKLYIGSLNGNGSPYTHTATALVNNDGVHNSQSRDGTINLSVGVYPIAVSYFEVTGGQSMSVQWRRPSTSSYSSIPDSVFVEREAVLGAVPAMPTNLTVTPVSYKRIDLSWVDNSNNETGFEVWRSTSALGSYSIVGTRGANATSFVDSTVEHSTTYYYKVRSIGQYGESPYCFRLIEANWKFNNNYNDAGSFNRGLTQNGNPAFDASAGNFQEGGYSLRLTGSNNQYVGINNTNNFLQDGFETRTVAMWVKSNNNTSNRIIADLGGSDDGLALMLNNNTLIGGVASNNVRSSISATYNNSNWNFIALVYSYNTLRLFINGSQVASNTSLAFSSVGTTTNGSRIGTNNGNNALNVSTSALFNGWIDNFGIYNWAMSAAELTALAANSVPGQSFGTSLPLPNAPLAPTGLLASGISTSANEITWTDNATDETAYELYRSAGGNSNYVLLATLPAGTVTYKDSGLFANSISYYRVRAKNVSGPSGYSNEDSAKTLNTVPVFVTSLSNQHMRYGTQLQLNVTAVDPDPELLNIQVTGLPAFGSYTPSGNGTGTLSFNPASVTDQGIYNDITVTVNDEHGGSSSQVFNLTVNDNYNPHIDPISNVTVAELQTAQLNVSATDQNVADVLSWEFIGLPGFATVSTNGGTAQLNFAPGYADNGVYPVQAKVTDGNNGFDTLTFYITVNDVNPDKKIYVNFTNGTYTSPAPWNNTAKNPVQNDNFAALKDETGATSAVGIQILTPWQSMTSSGVNTLGVSTNNNSGIYPDNVMRTSYFTTTVTQTLRIYGLSPLYKYNFTVFGSRANPAAGVVVVADYVMNGQTLSLNAANNSQNTVTFSNLSPAPDGTLNLDVRAQAGSQFAYLGALVISSVYDDGTAPAKPRNLAGQLVSGKVNLSWVDAAYNETGYEVYRSNSRDGVYTLLNPGGSTANLVSFTDSTVLGGPTYYYAVRAVNGIGASPYSDTIAVGTINTAPVFTSEVSDIRVGINEAKNVAVTAADIPGDVITLSATGLPSFASFTDNGNGNGVINVAGTGTVGTYGGITITATDNKGAAASRQIKIVVKNGVSTYVNFTNGTYTSPAPWNNTNSAPVANFTLSNLQDENGNGTGVSLTLPEAWTGSNTNGVVTGDNSGVYPDNVIRSFYYQSAPDVRTVRLSGLSATNKYNLVFFASRANYNLALTSSYTVGAQSVVLNATNNSSTTASINGVSPDANGQIIISIAAANGSQFSYLGALEIVSYPFDGTPSSPTNLVASGISKTQIKLDWTGTAENSGYQVWRSTSLNGSYSLLGTVGTNVTTYTNNGLSAGSSYYYKVRTITGANVYSAYSNVAAASTVAFQVNLNMNDGSVNAPGQPGGWNNINALIDETFELNNMINDQGQLTGINFGVARNFSGFNYFGTVTGNNSGIVPDNVLKSFYYTNFGDTATVKISGLSSTYLYNFMLLGSRVNPSVGVITAYKIGNQVITLSAANNTSNVALFSDIKPDAEGNVYITMYATVQGGFGYLNSLQIQGKQVVSTEETPPIYARKMNGGKDAKDKSRNNTAATAEAKEAFSLQSDKLTAFPSPFTDDVTLRMLLKENVNKLDVVVFDMNGRAIFSRGFGSVAKGVWQQKLGLSGRGLANGVYYIKVLGIPSENNQIKVIKQ